MCFFTFKWVSQSFCCTLYNIFSFLQFYQEELSQERLRIEQEMQVSEAL